MGMEARVKKKKNGYKNRRSQALEMYGWWAYTGWGVQSYILLLFQTKTIETLHI